MQQPETDVVYIDETSFNLWVSPGRLLIKQGMRVQLPEQRGKSITMIGALSVHQGLIHTETFSGTNTALLTPYYYLSSVSKRSAKGHQKSG
jgi:hypothetical protein